MRSPTPRRLLLAGALLTAFPLGLAACGDDSSPTADHGDHAAMHDSAVGTTASAEVATAAFVRQMIPHHEMAVVMAKAAARAEHAELREMAGEIVTAQSEEISELKAIAKAERISVAGAPDAMARDAQALGLDEGAMGMSMHTADLARAKPFDRAFLDMMIPHHQGAISMAHGVLAAGASGQVATLAQEIIDGQQGELAEMKTWRKVWYGDAVTPTPEAGATGGHDMGDHDMGGME